MELRDNGQMGLIVRAKKMVDDARQDETDARLDEIVKSELEATEAEEAETKARPYVVTLSRWATTDDIKAILIDAEKAYSRGSFSSIRMIVQGYEGDARHPATIGGAKRKYAQAIEAGLLGLLLAHGYTDIAQATYGIAYCKVKPRGDNLRFTKFNAADYTATVKRSIDAFNELLRK